MTVSEILSEAESLPLEERARLADSLLRTLNVPNAVVDARWAAVAKRRFTELKNGDVAAVPGDDVLERVWRRFEA